MACLFRIINSICFAKLFNCCNSTYWDDGNKSDGDGWSSICAIESGWTWSGGDSTHKDQWLVSISQGKLFIKIS